MDLLLAAVLVLARVHGVVVNGGPLPGVDVTLTPASGEHRKLVTDAQGEYRFDAPAEGRYTLRFELEGFETQEREIVVGKAANEQPPLELPLGPMEPFTMSCGYPCTDGAPDSVWSRPSCADYELDSSLIEAINAGDQSAIDLARRRHDTTETYSEKHRLAEALLRHVPIDSAYWNELIEPATNAVRFAQDEPGPSEALLRWCGERGIDPDGYMSMIYAALRHVAGDPRSRGLLLEALKSPDWTIAAAGIDGLARQNDASALPHIARALEASPDHASSLATLLATYHSEAADALAFQYMDEGDRATYAEPPTNEP